MTFSSTISSITACHAGIQCPTLALGPCQPLVLSPCQALLLSLLHNIFVRQPDALNHLQESEHMTGSSTMANTFAQTVGQRCEDLGCPVTNALFALCGNTCKDYDSSVICRRLPPMRMCHCCHLIFDKQWKTLENLTSYKNTRENLPQHKKHGWHYLMEKKSKCIDVILGMQADTLPESKKDASYYIFERIIFMHTSNISCDFENILNLKLIYDKGKCSYGISCWNPTFSKIF